MKKISERRVSVRIPEPDIRVSVPTNRDAKTVWEDAARRLEMSFSSFVRESLETMAFLDIDALAEVEKMSNKLGISKKAIINAALCHFIADGCKIDVRIIKTHTN